MWEKLGSFFLLSSFNFPSRRALLPQKDAGSICTTNIEGVAISQEFEESFIFTCYEMLWWVCNSDSFRNMCFKEASRCYGADEKRNYPFCLLVTIHCGHTFLKRWPYHTYFAVTSFISYHCHWRLYKENCETGIMPRHCLESWQFSVPEQCEKIFWQSTPINNRVPCLGMFPRTLKSTNRDTTKGDCRKDCCLPWEEERTKNRAVIDSNIHHQINYVKEGATDKSGSSEMLGNSHYFLILINLRSFWWPEQNQRSLAAKIYIFK